MRNRSPLGVTVEGFRFKGSSMDGIEGLDSYTFRRIGNIFDDGAERTAQRQSPNTNIDTGNMTRSSLSFSAAPKEKTHAKPDMVNVVNKKCGNPGCLKRASYGETGRKKVEFCKTHAKKGMVIVCTLRCIPP